MKRIDLLLDKLDNKQKMTNYIKLLLNEAIIIAVIVLIFNRGNQVPYRYVIIAVLALFAANLIAIQWNKINLIKIIKTNYKSNKKIVSRRLQQNQRPLSRLFNSFLENRIFAEIQAVLNSERLYKDQHNLGSWDFIYDREKTKQYSKSIETFELELYQNMYKQINTIPKEVIDHLQAFGIDYKRVFDIRDFNLEDDHLTYEIVYPVFGIITNESPQLRKQMAFDSYQITDECSITPLESLFKQHHVTMLTIKVDTKIEN